MPNRPTENALGYLRDIPLPGMYDCLTFQCNATLYPSINQLKYVVVLRDPKEQIELGRAGGQHESQVGVERVKLTIAASLSQALYLAGLTQGTES